MSLNETISNLGDSIINLVDKKRHGTLGLEQGDVGYDKEVWSDIYKYKHSTFDINKFEVVGSPNITEDGIASGFNGGSYLRFKQPLSGVVNVNCVWTYYKNAVPYAIPFALFMTPSEETINPVVVSSVNKLTLDYGVNSIIIEEGVTYNLKVVTDLKTFAELYVDGKLISNKVLNYTENYVYKIYIGTGKNNYPINGSIDLKQFSITVDGKEVFNGNKTGLDVIKEDNYTVVNRILYAYVYNDGSINHIIYANSPTTPIALYNADGTSYTGSDFTVADNVVSYGENTCTYTSASNVTLYINITEDGVAILDKQYVVTPIKGADLLNKSWSIEGVALNKGYESSSSFNRFLNLVHGSTFSSFGNIFMWVGNTKNITAIGFQARTGNADDSNTDGSKISKDISIPANGWETLKYKLVFDYPNRKYSLYYTFDNNAMGLAGEYIPETTSPNLYIWETNPNTDIAFDYYFGHDLNAFKIYVDGNLVYQPCLKIPYIESKTGSKVVNQYYLNRIEDMKDQFGYAPYYTIKETSENFFKVGNPTISNNSVISGFSDSNYISGPAPSWEHSLKVLFSFTLDSLPNGNNYAIFGNNIVNATGAQVKVSSTAIYADISNGTGWIPNNQIVIRQTWETGVKYTGALEFNDKTVTLKLAKVGGALQEVSKIFEESPEWAYGFQIGRDMGDPFTIGSIYLSDFKIYADDKLIWTPYTNPSYTLPMGDVYGVLSAKSNSSDIAGYAMPSDKYIDLTLGASGSNYTAPANGWYYFNKRTGVSNAYISIHSQGSSLQDAKNSSDASLTVIKPIQKGAVATVSYNATGTTQAFRFIYAEGEKQ